jgi:hypothetical protein
MQMDANKGRNPNGRPARAIDPIRGGPGILTEANEVNEGRARNSSTLLPKFSSVSGQRMGVNSCNLCHVTVPRIETVVAAWLDSSRLVAPVR